MPKSATVDGLRNLAELCVTEVIVGSASARTIPEARDSGKALLEEEEWQVLAAWDTGKPPSAEVPQAQ